MATKTASTVVLHAGEHLFKVVNHSLVKGSNTCLTSAAFRVGGHDWAICYYPNGSSRIVDDQFTSIFLELINTAGDSEVTAYCSFCLQDPAPSATGEKHKFGYTRKFEVGKHGVSWGRRKFVSKADLVASGYLQDDCLLIKCAITVIASKLVQDAEDNENRIIIPPSVLSKDLGNLLEHGLEADLTVRIGWFKSFKVHGCVLAARSPVFRALLCGPMMESRQNSIRLNDVDARVFEVLLYYMYNDCLPEFMEETTEDAIDMTQHLLVAADRYAMERLKLMCQNKLSKALEAGSLGFTLNLAEEFHCQQLKNYCLNYIARGTKRIRSTIKTNKFKRLKQDHQGVAYDILDKVIDKL
ncbi:BTB/POZ and MATH domain-containing protein 1-like [Lolium rigidum]|uniref:BTB/POZ and MATH domain-containing protein 1-like n=1 Tax=Lolium rigidum TaxID=89674 RepID=UPI001F5D5744|nr:BTB/POZ and MATH domain-containing protein 1-like [Lolium rigidum]